MVGDGKPGAPGEPSTWAGLYTPDFTAFAQAFARVGITLSVSPGSSMNLGNGTYIAATGLAAQYRTTTDFWELEASGGWALPTGLKCRSGG